MLKAKILVVGPCGSGKTCIANLLAEATSGTGSEYHPTQGVRILEFETEGVNDQTNKRFKAEVELWDCSGDKKFERCWPALWKNANGVVLVYNPDQAEQEQELEKWYTSFVRHQGLKDSHCVIFAHQKSNTPTKTQHPPTAPKLTNVRCVHTNLDEEPESVREEFSVFLKGLASSWRNQQDQEELGIVGQ